MNKEDVFYNVRLSIDFYFREVFCKKYGFYDTKIKKIQRAIKNKKYQLEDGILLTDGNGNAELNIYVKSGDEIVSDFCFDFNTNSIYFTESISNISITYNVINVDIVDAYPEDKSDDFLRQMIAISTDDVYSRPFDVSGKIHKWYIPFYIDMFLFNRVIRNRISNAISVMFKSIIIPIIDFSENGIIKKDGTFNKDFSFKKNAVSYIDKFGDLKIESNDLESFDKKKMYSCTVSGEISIIF
jgi:hypothetical protein